MKLTTMALEQLEAMSLQPLETPPLRVSRPVAACSRCRNAKIKCDGKLPACTSCEKNGRAAECTSTNDQFARGKERSYVSTLETRIDKLEAKIREAQARKPSVVSLPDNDTPVPSRRPSEQIQAAYRPPPPKDEVPTPTTGRRQRRREVSAIDDLVSDFGFLSVNATARDFHGFTQAMSYARLILWSCSKDELPKGTSKALPSRNDGIALVQFYLGNVFALLPAFDEANLWTAVENVYSKGHRMSTPYDHWMVRMVFAISNASMSRRSGDEHYLESISHVCAALDHSEQVLHPGNISGIQALLLLAEYAMLAPHHFDSWQLIGAASRAMTDLGYHQDPPRGTQMDRNRLETRRKVFYCIYVLDRSTSLVQTRAFSFSDASANVKVPFSKQPGKSSVSSESSASSPPPGHWLQLHEQAYDLVGLRKLQSAWYTELFQTTRESWEEPYPELWRICDGMRKWFDSLSPSTPHHMRQFFELDLLYSYVYVLSPSSRVPRIHQFAQKLIFEYCIRYTDLMLHLISDSAYTAPLTFYDAMRVYMTGRQFIDVLTHSLDMLLSGAVPPHPDVKPTSAPPPAMPVVPLPQGETLQRFNTYRAINCIKQTMDCMGRFGLRWGYMSWHQRYEHESKLMLDSLEQRLHVLDEANRARRVSMWGGSTASIPSSNGTSGYYSPPQTMSHGPTMYQQPTPQMPPKQQSYGDPAIAQQTSPPLFHQHSGPPRLTPQSSYGDAAMSQQGSPPLFRQHSSTQSVQQYPMQQSSSFGQMQPPYQQPAQAMNFGNPSYQPPTLGVAPGQQFAAWSGYGVSSGPDTLDEENASLYRTSTNQSSQSLISPHAGRGSIQQIPPHQQGNYVAKFESLPRSSVARPRPARISVDENVAPQQHRQFSQYGLHIPSSASLPALGPQFTAYDPSMPSPPRPLRRTSMQDASNDIVRATYPTVLPVPQPPIVREPSPRMFSPARQRRNRDKGKAVGIYVPPPPGGEAVGSCQWNSTFGYICEICSRICPRPDQHIPGVDGNRCVDLSGSLTPHVDDVEADVLQNPDRAIALANSLHMSMAAAQQRQGPMLPRDSMQEFQAVPQQQQQAFGDQAPAPGVAGPAYGRPGGGTLVPSFTTASQMRQWAGEGQQEPQQEQQLQRSGNTEQWPGEGGAGAGKFF